MSANVVLNQPEFKIHFNFFNKRHTLLFELISNFMATQLPHHHLSPSNASDWCLSVELSYSKTASPYICMTEKNLHKSHRRQQMKCFLHCGFRVGILHCCWHSRGGLDAGSISQRQEFIVLTIGKTLHTYCPNSVLTCLLTKQAKQLFLLPQS